MQEIYRENWITPLEMPITPPETPESSGTDCTPTKPLNDLDSSPEPQVVCSQMSQVCACNVSCMSPLAGNL